MKILEVLRLSEQLNYSLREIENTTICSKTTAGKILNRSKELELDYETAKTFTEVELKRLFFTEPVGRPRKKKPNFSVVHEKLKSSNKNLQFLWEQQTQNGETTLSYSRYCNLYRRWKESQGYGVYTPIERKPGEKLFVDWMGDTLRCVKDSQTGELLTAYFFVSTLGDSSYPYCEAFPSMNQFSWNCAHVNALTWNGALPKIIVPDNTKTAVTRARMWDPKLNIAYLELAQYYQVAIEPARIRRPKDKASVEASIRWLETWLLEQLNDYGLFLSFEELNCEIKTILKKLVQRNYTDPIRKQESRLSLFKKRDLPEMRALPSQPFEVYDFKCGTIPDFYHATYENFYYSVPYQLFKNQYRLHAYQHLIRIFIGKDCVATHQRRYLGSRYVTKHEHMPEKDKFFVRMGEKDGRYYRRWANACGQYCLTVVEHILSVYDYEPQGYKSCLGLTYLQKKYGPQNFEAACKRATELGCLSYTGISRILKSGSYIIKASSTANESVPLPSDLRTLQWKQL